jgi:curved DNA-binding protein CbpA
MSRDFRELGGRDAYALLGLDQGADAQEIKRAWRAMSRLHHADVGGSDNMQSLLNVAYDTLSDRTLRNEYDRYRRTVLLVGAAGPTPVHEPPARPWQQPPPGPKPHTEHQRVREPHTEKQREPHTEKQREPHTENRREPHAENQREPHAERPRVREPHVPAPEREPDLREPDEWDRWDYDEPEHRRFESEPEQGRHEAAPPFNAWSAPRQADPRRDFISTARPVGYDNLAIISLVLALVFAPAALVTAPMALYRIRRTGAQGRALAITALILVGVLTIALTSGYVIGARGPVIAR